MPCITPRPRRRKKPGLTEHRIKKRIPNPQNLFTTPRCVAKTCASTPSRAPCVRGKSRCRIHGGATASGAQPGNRNASSTDSMRGRNGRTSLISGPSSRIASGFSPFSTRRTVRNYRARRMNGLVPRKCISGLQLLPVIRSTRIRAGKGRSRMVARRTPGI